VERKLRRNFGALWGEQDKSEGKALAPEIGRRKAKENGLKKKRASHASEVPEFRHRMHGESDKNASTATKEAGFAKSDDVAPFSHG